MLLTAARDLFRYSARACRKTIHSTCSGGVAPARPGWHFFTNSTGTHDSSSTNSNGHVPPNESTPGDLSVGGGKSERDCHSPLLRHLVTKILMRGGPLSLAEYMQDALTSPHGGFYMSRDVFGREGDFTTSPEISQMFGEMIGAWVAHAWSGLGSPSRLALVELGPGRGTLMSDILRATAKFQAFRSSLEVHLVEVSPALRQLQYKSLRCSSAASTTHTTLTHTSTAALDGTKGVSHAVCGINNAAVYWHPCLNHVPRTCPAVYIAHEFLDALPVHQFVRDPQRGWLEKLVDVVPDRASDASPADHGQQLRLVLSPTATPATTLLVNRRLQSMTEAQAAGCDALEVSAHGMATAEMLAQRVGAQGGAALIVDYGQDGHYKDSLMAIQAHKGVEVLDAPGTADLSTWVDFAALRQAALGSGAPVVVAGPISQGEFLLQLGIEHRLQALLRVADPSQKEELISGFKRLTLGTESQGMGDSYKVIAITRKGQPEPAGFAGSPASQQL